MLRRKHGAKLLSHVESLHDQLAERGTARAEVITERLADLEEESAALRKALRKIEAARSTN